MAKAPKIDLKKRRKMLVRRRQIAQAAGTQPPTGLRVHSAGLSIHAASGQTTPRFRISPAYNGGLLPVKEFPFPVVIELASARFEKPSIKIYRNHDAKRPVGHTVAEEMEILASGPRKGIHLGGLLSVPGQDRDDLVRSAKDQFPWEASIEANFPPAELVAPGVQATVNGETFRGPFFIARNATIHGTAILARGADRNTHVTIAAELFTSQGEITMDPELKAFLDAKGIDIATAKPTELAAAMKDFNTAGNTGGGSATNADDLDSLQAEFQKQLRQSFAAESTRVASIGAICSRYNSPPTIKIGEGDKAEEVSLQAHAIEQGWDAERVELKAQLWDLGRRSGGQSSPGPRFTAEQMGHQQQVLEASLALHHFGLDEKRLAASYGSSAEKIMNEAYRLENRQHSLHSIMNLVIHAAGMSYSGQFKSMAYWEKMIEAHQVLQASGTSTLSLPNLFENVLNKSLLDSFMLVQGVWPEIAYIASAQDFKPLSRVRLTASGAFQRVGKDGEIKHVGMTDAKRTNQLETFGAMITLTRKDIINDDLMGLQRMTSMLGELAGNRLEEEVFVVLLAGIGSFFSAGNKNYLSGAGTALGPKSLGDARDLFINRVNTNGKPISTGPAILLHGVPLHDMADSLYGDELLDNFVAAANTKTPNRIRNAHLRKYRPVESVYVSNTDITGSDGKAITGQTQTGWGLFAMPRASLSVVEVAFLNGQRSPSTATSDMEFNKLGMQYRAHHDFGVALADEEAGVWMAGA